MSSKWGLVQTLETDLLWASAFGRNAVTGVPAGGGENRQPGSRHPIATLIRELSFPRVENLGGDRELLKRR